VSFGEIKHSFTDRKHSELDDINRRQKAKCDHIWRIQKRAEVDFKIADALNRTFGPPCTLLKMLLHMDHPGPPVASSGGEKIDRKKSIAEYRSRLKLTNTE